MINSQHLGVGRNIFGMLFQIPEFSITMEMPNGSDRLGICTMSEIIQNQLSSLNALIIPAPLAAEI